MFSELDESIKKEKKVSDKKTFCFSIEDLEETIEKNKPNKVLSNLRKPKSLVKNSTGIQSFDGSKKPTDIELQLQKFEESFNELMKILRKRKQMNNSDGVIYNITDLVGGIVRWDSEKQEYIEIGTDCLYEPGNEPKMNFIDSKNAEINYFEKIYDDKSINFFAPFFSFNAEKKILIEASIIDEISVTIDKKNISLEKIKEFKQKITEYPLTNYHVVMRVTITSWNHRIFKETNIQASLKADVSTTYITAGGKAYKSDEKIVGKKAIYLGLIQLTDFIT